MEEGSFRFLAAFGMVEQVRIIPPFGSHMTHLPPQKLDALWTHMSVMWAQCEEAQAQL